MALSFRPPKRSGQKDARLSELFRELSDGAEWKDRFQYNEFACTEEMLNGHDVLEPVDRIAAIRVRRRLQELGYRKATRGDVVDAISDVCHARPYHPVRDWLEGLKWDGVRRLDHWMVDCLGCDSTEYVRGIGRLFILSMVARSMKPGCQLDYMLILEGRQGIGKSRACRALGGDWFSDSLPLLSRDEVRVSMALRGKMLIEIAELDPFKGARIEGLKAFITRPVEDYTPKFAAGPVSEPRSCVLIGTTNQLSGGYLDDSTGARRFWPVRVHEVDVERLAGMREQLFAEGVVAWKAGEPWWPDPEFIREQIEPEQEARQEVEEWVEPIEKWLKSTGAQSVTFMEIWVGCFKKPEADYKRETDGRRIRISMEYLGWVKDKHHGKRQRWVEGPIC